LTFARRAGPLSRRRISGEKPVIETSRALLPGLDVLSLRWKIDVETRAI